jgi:hypothetical protein
MNIKIKKNVYFEIAKRHEYELNEFMSPSI